MKKEPEIMLPPVEQIGIVVKDVDQAVEFFSATFGWGPFKIRESRMQDVIYDGRPSDCRLKMAFARSGDVEIELIQVLEERPPTRISTGVMVKACSTFDSEWTTAMG